MKKILFVAATLIELNSIKQSLTNYKAHKFYFFEHKVGIPFSLFTLQKFFLTNKICFDLVIQIGICGSFGRFKIGQVVNIMSDCFGDMGVIEDNTFKNLFDLNLLNQNTHPFKKGKLKNNQKKLSASTTNILNNLPQATAISVQQISTIPKIINYFKTKYNADVESMEGACFHFIMAQYKMPHLQIRSVSNLVGERNKKKWKIQLALSTLNTEIKKIIKSL